MEEKFVHVFFKEYSNSVSNNFKNFLDNDLYVDLIFICCNGRKVKAHQIVLAYLSNFLFKILTENRNETSGKMAYICIPDIRYKLMDQIIQFIYTGQITIDAKDLKDFHETMQLLGMPSCKFTHVNEASSSSSSIIGLSVKTLENCANVNRYGLALTPKNCTPKNINKDCAAATAIIKEKKVKCLEEEVSVPTILNVRSLIASKKKHSNSSDDLPVISPVAANIPVINNEAESIKKLAENLLIQLKRMSHSSRKLRQNNKIRSRLQLKMKKKNENFKAGLDSKIIFNRSKLEYESSSCSCCN